MEMATKQDELKKYFLDPEKSGIKAVFDTVKENGLAVLPSFIPAMELEQLNNEFEELVKTRNRAIKPFALEKGEGVGILRKKLKSKDFPATADFFNRPFMHVFIEHYVHPTAKLNSKIYVVRDVVGTTTYANDLHFDVQKCLKFFIYLNDVSANNGAFEFVPGTHKWVEDIRRSDKASEITFENRELSRQLPYKEEDVISLEAPAGTMFIFDTDMFHRTGTTSMGERKIMRGHTYFDEVKDPDPIFAKTIR
ncbi:MAG: hypothetical protein CMP59_05340 [Flavobacteriales bacterium]|nr:hypothetical protein [Flavobacteriales bacterium]